MVKRIFEIFVALVLVAAAGFFGYRLFGGEETSQSGSLMCEYKPGQAVNNCAKRQYFRDRLVAVGDERVFALDFNRKQEEDGRFVHYYYLNVYDENGPKDYGTSFVGDEPQVQPSGFLGSFENEMAADLSTMESYTISGEVPEGDFELEIAAFEGDFITKNTLEYTRYNSVADGKLRFLGEDYEVKVFLEKAYSNDHSKWIFFDGLEDLSSRTYRFVFFDERGGFYLLDKTEVIGENPAYTPHVWYLEKQPDGAIYKVFDAELEVLDDGDLAHFRFTARGREFDLKFVDPTTESWSEGRITGNVDGMEVFGWYGYKRR